MNIIVLIFCIILKLIGWIEWGLMFYIILGWFIFFNAIKNRNGVFFRLYVFMASKIDPILNIFRRMLPNLGGFDFSILILFLILHFVKICITKVLVGMLMW